MIINKFRAGIVGVLVAAGCAGEVAEDLSTEDLGAVTDSLCTGTGCNGRDPRVEGCRTDGVALATVSVSGGTLTLKNSPRCGASWAEFSQTSKTYNNVWVEGAGGSGKTATVYGLNSTLNWSNLLAQSPGVAIKACVQRCSTSTPCSPLPSASCTALTKPTSIWSNAGPYQHTSTSVQAGVVTRAQNALASGVPLQSTSLAQSGFLTWQPDTASGDGGRIRQAWGDLRTHCKSSPSTCGVTTLPASVRTLAEGRLASYPQAQRTAIVNRVLAVGAPATSAPPTNDEGVLTRLGIRAQCKEEGDRLVIAAGGKPKTYSATGASPASVRAGYYAFTTNLTHTALITAVLWDLTKSPAVPLKYRIVEANFGTGWANPSGQVPWSRTIGTREVLASGFKAVSPD